MQNIKIIKLLIPPIFIHFYKKFLPVKIKEKMWSGDYSTWKEAAVLCSGYDNNFILEKCKNALLKVKNGQAVYERDSVLFDKIQYSWGLLAGLQKIAIENENELSVLDFGGSLGSSYFQNKTFLNNLKKIEWNVVEQVHFVDCGKIHFENKALNFYHTIEDCLSKYKPNVLLLSGVLQYLENPQEWIKKFDKLDIDYILIDRTTEIYGKNILSVQVVPETIYKASYPCWFFSHNYIKDNLIHYDLIASFEGFCDPVDYNLNDTTLANWKGYIFKRK